MWRRLANNLSRQSFRAAACLSVAGAARCAAQQPALAERHPAAASKPPKVVLASNRFRGCLSAEKACRAMAKGITRAMPDAEVVMCPMADGADGTLEVIVAHADGGFFISGVEVEDPLGRPVKAGYGMVDDGDTAIIEMAMASGLSLLGEHERDALRTSTKGTGQLMRHALQMGAKRLVLCLGGSATNDGGVGAAYALGYRFFDGRGNEVEPQGGNLLDIRRIDSSNVDERLKKAEVIVACNVINPLYGPGGATEVFGAVKGIANAEAQQRLDQGLQNLASLWETMPDTPPGLGLLQGAGAAGGLGGGAVAFFGARFMPGIDLVAKQQKLRQHLENADLVFTGEGTIHEQTGHGSVPFGVAKIAADCGTGSGVPVVGIFGSIQNPDLIRCIPILGEAPIFSLVGAQGPLSLEEAMDPDKAQVLIEEQAFNAMRLWRSCLRVQKRV